MHLRIACLSTTSSRKWMRIFVSRWWRARLPPASTRAVDTGEFWWSSGAARPRLSPAEFHLGLLTLRTPNARTMAGMIDWPRLLRVGLLLSLARALARSPRNGNQPRPRPLGATRVARQRGQRLMTRLQRLVTRPLVLGMGRLQLAVRRLAAAMASRRVASRRAQEAALLRPTRASLASGGLRRAPTGRAAAAAEAAAVDRAAATPLGRLPCPAASREHGHLPLGRDQRCRAVTRLLTCRRRLLLSYVRSSFSSPCRTTRPRSCLSRQPPRRCSALPATRLLHALRLSRMLTTLCRGWPFPESGLIMFACRPLRRCRRLGRPCRLWTGWLLCH